MYFTYFILFCLCQVITAKPTQHGKSIVIRDSADLQKAASNSESGVRVVYDKEFLQHFAVKLRGYLAKILESLDSIREDVLEPINDRIDSWDKNTTAPPESSEETEKPHQGHKDENKEPKHHHEHQEHTEHEEHEEPKKHKEHTEHKEHKIPDDDEDTDDKDLECEKYNKLQHRDDLLEMEMAEECARRAKQKKIKALTKEDKPDVVDGGDSDRDKRGNTKSRGLNVYSEMFLKNE